METVLIVIGCFCLFIAGIVTLFDRVPVHWMATFYRRLEKRARANVFHNNGDGGS